MWWHVTSVTNWIDGDPTRRPDGNPSDTAIVQGKSKPSFGWKLKCTTNEISDHICMTSQDLVTVLSLAWLCSMKISPECCLDSGTVLVKLLQSHARVQGFVLVLILLLIIIEIYSIKIDAKITHLCLWPPIWALRNWLYRSAFSQKVACLYWNITQVLRYDWCCILGSCHWWLYNSIKWYS